MAHSEEQKKALGLRLAEARARTKTEDRKAMTGDEVAAWLTARGYSTGKAALSSWEKGRNIPDALVLGMLAECYGVSADLLLTGVDRWPFAPALLDQVRELTASKLAQVEGAVIYVLGQASMQQTDQAAA